MISTEVMVQEICTEVKGTGDKHRGVGTRDMPRRVGTEYNHIGVST